MTRVAVLGSTGSVGTNALDVISSLKGEFKVVGLSANANAKLLARQAALFKPKVVSVQDGRCAKVLERGAGPGGFKIVCGEDGLSEIATRADVDLVVFAISGSACLKPLLAAIEAGKTRARANKEAVVMAGEHVMSRSKANGARLIPVDSEHSAIFQCLEGGGRRYLKRIYLTSSGGPLLGVSKGRFDAFSPKRVLRHPKWRMGRKISVDSASLMNKGLEIIEARWLFDVDQDDIEVVIHPEAIIHSMVEFTDGVVMAEIARPDMRLPIQYALTYPARRPSLVKRLDFSDVGRLTFLKPDLKKFPCLTLAREALKKGYTYPAVLSAADEEAVSGYLAGKIRFTHIPVVIEKVLMRHAPVKAAGVDEILEADAWARVEARRLCCH
jgi:1-deoxy-D-xylulose-5-phosphate reductoisomerase